MLTQFQLSKNKTFTRLSTDMNITYVTADDSDYSTTHNIISSVQLVLNGLIREKLQGAKTSSKWILK